MSNKQINIGDTIVYSFDGDEFTAEVMRLDGDLIGVITVDDHGNRSTIHEIQHGDVVRIAAKAPALKSLMPVRLYGAGNNGNWAARARMTDGSESFLGHGAGYTLAQAQSAIDNARGNLSGFAALPDGIKVKA